MNRLPRNSRLKRFCREEDGLATFEACLWIPFFLVFLILVLDATMIFYNQGKVHRIVQDANRQYVIRQIKTTGELGSWVEAALSQQDISANAVATATVDGNDILTTTVAYPSSDTDLSGATGLLGGLTMRVTNHTLTESNS